MTAPVSAPPPPAFDRPVFIVCSPRSGSSLLFETLAQAPGLWTIGGESHGVFEGVAGQHPSGRGWDSNRLTAADASPGVVHLLTEGFRAGLRDREGRPPDAGAAGLRLLEKTPKNALRVPFLTAAYPDALFIYLHRDPLETLSSMLEAWRSGRYATYPSLPGWEGPPWSMLLVPGWRQLVGRGLAEIVARQWATATSQLLDDLADLPRGSWCVADYDRLVAEPQAEIERLCRFARLEWDRVLGGPLPLSSSTLTAPVAGKWRRNAEELASVTPLIAEVGERTRGLFAGPFGV